MNSPNINMVGMSFVQVLLFNLEFQAEVSARNPGENLGKVKNRLKHWQGNNTD